MNVRTSSFSPTYFLCSDLTFSPFGSLSTCVESGRENVDKMHPRQHGQLYHIPLFSFPILQSWELDRQSGLANDHEEKKFALSSAGLNLFQVYRTSRLLTNIPCVLPSSSGVYQKFTDGQSDLKQVVNLLKPNFCLLKMDMIVFTVWWGLNKIKNVKKT